MQIQQAANCDTDPSMIAKQQSEAILTNCLD